MAQPDFVPVAFGDRPRRDETLPPPRRWTATRPADLVGRQPSGSMLGNPGPDQGFGLVLAKRFVPRLHLETGEHTQDVVAGCLGVGLRRAARFGRAPVIHDMEVAYLMWGYLDPEPQEALVAYRRPLFAGASHHYWDQRLIVDSVPASTFDLTPAQAGQQMAGDWRVLLGRVNL